MAEVDVADVLEYAADVVLPRDGWCQNEMVSPDGRVCLSGALARAALELTEDVGCPEEIWSKYTSGAYDLWGRSLLAVEKTVDVEAVGWVPEWNDAPGRTEGEVSDALRLTAKGLRNEAVV